MQRVRIWSLVQELRSHVPYGAASKNYFKKKKATKRREKKIKRPKKLQSIMKKEIQLEVFIKTINYSLPMLQIPWNDHF